MTDEMKKQKGEFLKEMSQLEGEISSLEREIVNEKRRKPKKELKRKLTHAKLQKEILEKALRSIENNS